MFTKMKSTPPLVVDIMTRMTKGKVIEMDVDINVKVDEDPSVHEPVEATIIPDPDILDQLVESEEEEEEELRPNIEDELEVDVDPSLDDEVEVVRRSNRATAGKTNKYDAYSLVTAVKTCGVSDAAEVGMSLANLSVKNALKTHGKLAYDAIKDELTQLFVTKEALKLVRREDIPRESTEVRSHMFLKLKVDANGVPEKLMARLVADGSTQDRSRYEVYEVSAPTASLPSIMNVLKIAVQECREYMVFDITGAYLNSQMKETVYLIITDKRMLNILRELYQDIQIYLDQHGRAIALVDKALYGLIESANLWNKTLTKVLTDDGFTVNDCDPCVLNRTSAGVQTTVVIYVDDLLVSSKDITHIRAVKNLIELQFDEVKQKSGTSFTYLGMNLMKVQDNMKGFYSLEITMIGFTESILQEWNGYSFYPYSVPADDKLINCFT